MVGVHNGVCCNMLQHCGTSETRMQIMGKSVICGHCAVLEAGVPLGDHNDDDLRQRLDRLGGMVIVTYVRFHQIESDVFQMRFFKAERLFYTFLRDFPFSHQRLFWVLLVFQRDLAG